MSGNNVQSLPNGFVCTQPWASVDKTMYIDLKVFLSSARLNRNILSDRKAARSKSNINQEVSFILPKVESTQPYAAHTLQFNAGNIMTVVTANRKVRVKLTTPNGTIDLGQISLLAFDSTATSIEFINDLNEGNVEITLVQV